MESPTSPVILPQSEVHLLSGNVKTFVHPSPKNRPDDEYIKSLQINETRPIGKELSVVVFQPEMNRLPPTSGQGRTTFLYRKLETVSNMYCKLQTLKVYSFRVSPDGNAFWQLRYL